MKNLILGLSFFFSMSLLQAQEFRVKPCDCVFELDINSSLHRELDVSTCQSRSKDIELRNFVINSELTSGFEIKSISFVSDLSNDELEKVTSKAQFLTESSMDILQELKSSARKIDLYYVVDNYQGGTGEVAYFLFHSKDSKRVKVLSVTTYVE